MYFSFGSYKLGDPYMPFARVNGILAVPPTYRGSTHERLAATGVPILYIVGEEDAIAVPRTIEIAASQVPKRVWSGTSVRSGSIEKSWIS